MQFRATIPKDEILYLYDWAHTPGRTQVPSHPPTDTGWLRSVLQTARLISGALQLPAQQQPPVRHCSGVSSAFRSHRGALELFCSHPNSALALLWNSALAASFINATPLYHTLYPNGHCYRREKVFEPTRAFSSWPVGWDGPWRSKSVFKRWAII